MSRRPYQQQCLNNINARKLAEIRRILISMFTGAGKSLIFSGLPEYMPSHKRMMMMVHTQELVEQGAAHLRHWNPSLDVGIEMADQVAKDEHQIVVASVQTIGREGSRRLDRFDPDEFEWLAVDEAHRSLAQTYTNVFEHFRLFDDAPGTTLVGVTATPNRSDGQAMGQVYQEIAYQYSIKDGIKDGWLVEPRGYRVRTTTDLSNISTVGGDFAQDELGKAVNTPARNDAIVKAWMEYAWPRPTIAFCVDIQHAKDLAYAFQKNSVPAEAIWGADPRRKEKIADLRAGQLLLLSNAQLLTEGFDLPALSCVIMARPTKSQTFFIQAVGRGLRLDGIGNLEEARRTGSITPNTKTDCLVIDVCDVTGRHSLITLPTLFGLSAKLDLKGKSVYQAAKMIEEAQAQNPSLDFDKLEDITKLKTHVEEANLWEVRFSEEVKEHSQLQWHTSSNGSYVLLMPGKESMVVFKNMLDKYSVVGSIKGQQFNEQGFNSLPEAFGFAEMNLSLQGKEFLTLLRRESKWMKAAPSDKQLNALRRFRVPEHVIAEMTKGDAAKFLTKKFAGRI